MSSINSFLSILLIATSLHADIGTHAANFLPTATTALNEADDGSRIESGMTYTASEIGHAGRDPGSTAAVVPTARLTLSKDNGKPQWNNAMTFHKRGNQYIAHFRIDTVDLIDENGGTGVVLYVATATRKAAGMYNLRIAITQGRRGAVVTVYDSEGKKVDGQMPLLNGKPEAAAHDLILPWRDGMHTYYSVLVQIIETKPCVAVIKHSRSSLPAGHYYQAFLHDMLSVYAKHPILQNRPGGFLEQVDHMKLLPMPYTSPAYGINLRSDLYLGMAVKIGKMQVTPF